MLFSMQMDMKRGGGAIYFWQEGEEFFQCKL
jgi:hypothetical protein